MAHSILRCLRLRDLFRPVHDNHGRRWESEYVQVQVVSPLVELADIFDRDVKVLSQKFSHRRIEHSPRAAIQRLGVNLGNFSLNRPFAIFLALVSTVVQCLKLRPLISHCTEAQYSQLVLALPATRVFCCWKGIPNACDFFRRSDDGAQSIGSLSGNDVKIFTRVGHDAVTDDH